MSRMGRLRFRGRPGSPVQSGDHPRLFVAGQDGVTALRTELANDATFQSRWSTGVGEFTSAGGVWQDETPDDVPYNYAVASFLTAIRRSDNDLGIASGTWGTTWQAWLDKILAWAYSDYPAGPVKDGSYPPHATALALVYDNLYPDLTSQQRTDFQGWVEEGFQNFEYMTGGGVPVWDGGASDDHFAKTFSALASESVADRLADAYLYSMRIVDSYDWMPMAFGLGRDFHEGIPRAPGLPMLLLALKNAGGYTDAQTIDHFTTHLRDNWLIAWNAFIPHPHSASSTPLKTWVSDKFHTQDARMLNHRTEVLGAFMANALGWLPGKIDLDGTGISDQATLADSEAAYFGYLRTVFDMATPGNATEKLRNAVNAKEIGYRSNNQARFWCFPSWWLRNVPEASALSQSAAGVPYVRRYGPGTLEWTFIHSADWAHNAGTVVRYTHRRYGSSNYEEGTRQNGRWHAHRNGPLFIQGGETGHGVNTRKRTAQANGCLSFLDASLYGAFELANLDDEDGGGTRIIGSGANGYKDVILANANLDYGQVTAWYADSQVVAITSDLTRSYNSTAVTTGTGAKNAAKVSSVIREFVTLRDGSDGTDRVTVLTYDRITLTDADYRPMYHFVTGPPPDIDGTETEVTPHAPSSAPIGQDPSETWTATGPTMWDYANATRVLVDNTVEPDVLNKGTGKGQLTWLEPSGANAFVRRMSGLNAQSGLAPNGDGTPGMTPLGGWQPKEDWAGESSMEARAYTGTSAGWIAPISWGTDVEFLMVCDLMDSTDTPETAEALTCDAGSKAARCGARAVVFSVSASGHTSGSVTLPTAITLVVLVNLTPNAEYTLTPDASVTIDTAERTASNTGVLVVGVTVASQGDLDFAED